MTSTRHIPAGIALALALATSAAPASARPFDLNANGPYVPVTVASTQAPSQVTPMRGRPVGPQATVVPTAQSGGFDWGDAGIGAAGGVALSVLGLGGTLAVSQHRTRRTRHTTAMTS
jgi:hypothetical protein